MEQVQTLQKKEGGEEFYATKNQLSFDYNPYGIDRMYYGGSVEDLSSNNKQVNLQPQNSNHHPLYSVPHLDLTEMDTDYDTNDTADANGTSINGEDVYVQGMLVPYNDTHYEFEPEQV